MPIILGPGIKAAMDNAKDQPITDEWTEIHDNAKVVKAWGMKGLYVASDDSGEWRTGGPFAEG
jgi:hypothetical protein